jgi:hypothetical protein
MIPKLKIIGTQMLITNVNLLTAKGIAATEQALKKVAILVINDAKLMAPVDTGRLRASLTVNWSGSQFARAKPVGQVGTGKSGKPGIQGISDGVGRPDDRKGFWVAAGTNVVYAEDVHDRIPYLWAAFKQNEAKIKTELQAALKGALRL